MSIPYKYTQEAQAERHWRSKQEGYGPKHGDRDGYNRELYRDGYDGIDWGKKG